MSPEADSGSDEMQSNLHSGWPEVVNDDGVRVVQGTLKERVRRQSRVRYLLPPGRENRVIRSQRR
jgi:hypothetical protein